jgi:hypothetical protein
MSSRTTFYFFDTSPLLTPEAQELGTVDKSCSTVNSIESGRDECHEIEGTEISGQSKRDIGMMLEVIITYKNKYTPRVIYCLAITFHA